MKLRPKIVTDARISSSAGNSFQKEFRKNLQKMKIEFKRRAEALALSITRMPKLLQKLRSPAGFDICIISRNVFHFNCKSPKNKIFTTNFYEINRILDEEYLLDPEPRPGLSNRFPCRAGEIQIAEITNTGIGNAWELVLYYYKDYLDIFSKAASDLLPLYRTYDYKIALEGSIESDLGYSFLYKISIEELETIKQYLLDNLDKGFIKPSQAPFAAPVLFVKKPNRRLRFCIDYRKLNLLTRKDRYPLPLIDEILARIAKAKIFTKLDIRQAFHRIRMDPASEELITFRTRYGAYKCKILPFGLTNGLSTYQRYINNMLFDYLDDFCTAYLDDILIYSESELEHEHYIKKVLQRLRDVDLQADIKKCEFNIKQTKYLSFIISIDRIQVDLEKVSIVKNWPYPEIVKGI